MRHDNDILWRYCVIAAERLNGSRLSDHKFNFKCNVCGDGHHKKRGYLVFDTSRDLIYYKCFNEGDCAAAGDGNTWHASRWLKFTDHHLYESYLSELKESRIRRIGQLRFRSQPASAPGNVSEPVSSKVSIANRVQTKTSPTASLELTDIEKEFNAFLPIKKCPDQLKEQVKEFCLGRMIPKERVREFRIAVNGKYRNRIIIPSFDENHKLIYFQARALFDHIVPKYLNSVAPRENVIYGLDRVDKSKPVIVLEGPIDSMFIENAVATMGCSYSKEVQSRLDKMNCLYLMDNDRAGNSKSRELLKTGHKVFLWSKFAGENNLDENLKDMNDYVVSRKVTVPLTFNFLSKYFSDSQFSMVYLTK